MKGLHIGRGQKTPTALAKLRGNPGKRPLPKNEIFPEIEAAKPEPPDHLDIVGRQTWDRQMACLYPLGLATKADYESLALYCDNYSRWWKARKVLNQKGDHYVKLDKDSGEVIEYKIRPQVQIYLKLSAMMHKWHSEFGQTPAARARMGTGHKDENPMEPLDKFLENSFGNSQEVGEA